jgi:uncharacterized protein (DUF885 family)
MHALGWDLGHARAFMLAHTAASPPDVDAELKRYLTWPGQACAYKVSLSRRARGRRVTVTSTSRSKPAARP